jgi:DNA repair exonuclease SbcCD ATPase subunit
MDGVATAVRKDTGGDERAALREAQAQAETARKAVEERKAAIERAKQLIADAERRVIETNEALTSCREQQADMIAAGAIAGTPPTTSTALRAARLAEADAQDALMAAKAALVHVRDGLADLEHEAAFAMNSVLTEINVIVRPIVEQLLADGRKKKLQVLETQVILQELVADLKIALPGFAREIETRAALEARMEPLSDIRAQVQAFDLLARHEFRAARTGAPAVDVRLRGDELDIM